MTIGGVDAEPITLFSRKADVKGVLDLLRSMDPGLVVVGPEDDWERITVTGGRRLLRKPRTLTFTHERDYYAGPDWPRQMEGMQAYVSRFPPNELTPRIMLLIQSFRFAVATLPGSDLDIDSSDERLRYVFAVAKHLDGVIFTPSSLRDAAGRILTNRAGDTDPSAVMPAVLVDVPNKPRDQRKRSEGGTLPDEDSPQPPAPQRVARRALALAAVSGRALLEQEDQSDPAVEETRQRIVQWVNDVGIGDELEPEEWKLIQRPVGAAERQDAVNGVWRIEGLGVLAWALGLYDLRPHDKLVDPGELLPAVGILNVEKAQALLASPELRGPAELKAASDRLFALHWRVTNFRLRQEAMNFVELADNAWFGPLNIGGLRLIDNDLAFGDKPIASADPDQVGACTSAARERHLAINWLHGYSEVYSETDVST